MSDEYLQTLGIPGYVNGYYVTLNNKSLNGDVTKYLAGVANVRSELLMILSETH